MVKYDGIICDSTVSVRRLAFAGAKGNIHPLKDLYVWQYDDSLTGETTVKPRNLRNLQAVGASRNLQTFDKENYLLKENGSIVSQMQKANPAWHWTVPYVTGHKYYIRWLHGLDFEQVQLQIIPWLW